MADQIFMPRALDENGDTLTAYAYFYTAGTTTPLSVYANQTLTVAHPTPLPSDAAGAFPQVFITSGTAVRTDVRDADTVEGTSLPGYPVDPSPVMSIASSAANGVTFAPVTGNSSTNVQDAIAINTARHENRSADVKDLLDASNDSEFRTKLGLGGLATQNILDEDNFASNSATRPPSQQSVKEYISIPIPTDLSGTRSFDTTYQNNSSRDLHVWASNVLNDAASISSFKAQISVNGSTWITIATATTSQDNNTFSFYMIVPPSYRYRVVKAAGANTTYTVDSWAEA